MESDLIAHRYKPLFPRARGGFSDVVIAWDTRLARRVAIKRINTGTSLPVASLEEARTAALLSSPNIVSVYDFEHSDTETLIVMENVDGPSLAELMTDSSELLDVDVATTILDGIVSALEYAHENQVLHLDIKPANVLIDQSGHIKVSDFGLAELAGAHGFGEVQGGTIGYMPPEQLTGASVEIRTDVWALAALSYQLLTGVNPFFALSPRESLERIISGTFALPSELRPILDGSIDETLMNALSPQIEKRPSSVSEFWLGLRPHLGRISPGRRRLKSLVSAWAGKEAALLEGTADLPFEAGDESLMEEIEETQALLFDEAEEQQDIAIWGGNYKDEDDWSDTSNERRQWRAQNRANRREERAARGPKPPLWDRLTPRTQLFFARCVCVVAAAGMAGRAMSALPYLSDPVAQAATAAAANTGNPTPALLDAAFAARLTIMLIVALVAFIVPSVGVALAALCLVLGFFFTGNWLIGMLVLTGCAAWWICVGRRSPTDATVFTLSPLLAVISLPMLLPLFAGYFETWRRALGTAALGCFICSLLSILTFGIADAFFAPLLGIGEMPIYGQFGLLPLEELLRTSPTLMQMPDNNELFIPLISLFTSLEFWFIFVSWLGASVVMSLLIGGKSRVKWILATLCGAGIVAAGYLIPFFLFSGTDNVALFAATIIRLVISLAVCLLLIALGVQPKPYVEEGRGRAR